MYPAPDEKRPRVILTSAPWPLYHRPSIQLGSLRAYLAARFPGLPVAAHHFYLDVAFRIGFEAYDAVSRRMWLSESVFAALLYPSRHDRLARLFRGEARRSGRGAGLDFDRIVRAAHAATAAYLDETDWPTVDLCGVSICLSQTTASLYLIRRIKRRCPDLAVVVGGAPLAPETLGGLFDHFPEIDAVVVGEGERPLAAVVAHLQAGGRLAAFDGDPAVVTADAVRNGSPAVFSQVADLDRLPVPDFDDYFARLGRVDAGRTFFPTLPVEVSRGCWWRETGGKKTAGGCAFCNLNRQWTGYRAKRPDRAATEIDILTERYRTLSVALTDNLLPARTTPSLCRELAGLKKDIELFGEMRATTAKPALAALRAAGMDAAQIGIEALSTRLLGKINKGTSAIRNLAVMRDCEELGIRHDSNLILCFPGSDDRDVAETLRALEFAAVFRPLKCVRFWLGTGSPVWAAPERFAVRAICNHPRYRILFPRAVARAVDFPVKAYRGDRQAQERRWRPVAARVRRWRREYERLRGRSSEPILSVRDGGTFLVIRQRRLSDRPRTHRLTGPSRDIYRYCRRPRALAHILARFPDLEEDRLRPFLHMMVDKRLMYSEGDRYLSLAASVSSRCRAVSA